MQLHPSRYPRILSSPTLSNHLSQNLRRHIPILRSPRHDLRNKRFRQHMCASSISCRCRMLQDCQRIRLWRRASRHCTGWSSVVLLRGHVRSTQEGRKGNLLLIFQRRLLLFLVFFPRHPTLPNNIDKSQYTWKTAATVAFVCLLHGLLVIFISASLTLARPHDLGQWANALGIMATILAAIQYFPQIWMTWHLGHVGSLSIPMMLIQTPGSFVWSGSLFARLGLEGWSSWGVFLVTGCLQGVLLAMCICFEIRDRRARDAEHDDVSGKSQLCSGNVLMLRSRFQLRRSLQTGDLWMMREH